MEGSYTREGVLTLRSRKGWKAAVGLALSLTLVPLLWGQGSRREPRADTEPSATGPAAGEKIPSFRAPDQYGRMQDFNSIRGPKGAMIVFFRSADW